jgi:hypothetical protein
LLLGGALDRRVALFGLGWLLRRHPSGSR